MDRTGSRFLVIKEKEQGDYNLCLVRIKGEEAESVVRKVEISEPRPAREKADGERAENLTSNPDFSQGLETKVPIRLMPPRGILKWGFTGVITMPPRWYRFPRLIFSFGAK